MGENKKFKFDVIIGNPPYQEESGTVSSKNKQSPRKNIFQHFQIAADDLAKDYSVLIYPGGRWIHQSGKGMQKFGLELINDTTLDTLIYYPKSSDVFPTTDIPDGISIVVKNYNKTTPGFKYTYVSSQENKTIFVDNPGNKLMPLNPSEISLVQKINKFVYKYGLKFLHDGILPRSLFSIESDFVELNNDKVRKLSDGNFNPESEVKLFTNDKAGSSGRSEWFVVDKNTITQNKQFISEWQVVVSSAHPAGQDGRDNQMSIIDNHSAFGRARVALKSFKTQKEAQNFVKYANANIIKYAFLITDESLTSLAKEVPDLGDYSDSQKLIDFSKDINEQLCEKMEFTNEEIKHIDEVIQKAWKNNKKEMA